MTLARLRVDSPVWPQLRRHLRAAGYHEAGIVAQLGGVELPRPDLSNLPRLRYRTRGSSVLEILLRLFLLGLPVSLDDAATALAPMSLAELAAAGLLEQSGPKITATVLLTPVDGLLIAADPPWCLVAGGPADAVAGVSSSSRLLADITVRRPAAHMLDFGAGQGFQALKAASHCASVTAIDVNPRAAALTRINAALNGCTRIAVHAGDGYAAVNGQTFDLIAGNLPFVVSPGRKFVYRDNTLGRDEFARRILLETPAFLNEGGYAHFVFSWVHLRNENGDDRLAELFDESGCDVWVGVTDREAPDEYADKWIGHTESGDAAARQQVFTEWLDYYEKQEITGLSTGVVTMHRQSGRPNWFHLEAMPARESPVGELGPAVEALFARYGSVLTLTDKQLLALRIRKSAALELSQRARWTGAEWTAEELSLRPPGPLIRRAAIAPAALSFLDEHEGRTVREVAAGWAKQNRVPRSAAQAELLPLVRQWLLAGFLETA